MDSDLSFVFRNRRVPVTFLPSISGQTARRAVDSEIFQTWSKRCEKENLGKKIEIHGVEIQHVDMFGPRVGFVKIKANSTLVDGKTQHEHPLPGICFLRGGAVAILVALICREDGEVYSMLVDQPRIPIGTVSCLELPAGMIDSKNDGIAGTAAREMEEECGIKLRASELTDLTELGCSEAVQAGTIPCAGVAPSPGGCDEFLRYMYTERVVTKEDLEDMKGRLSGLRDEGEFITLRVVKLKNLWKTSADNKAMCSLFLVDQLRKDGKLPPLGGLLEAPRDPRIRMQDGRVIPVLGFGLYKVPTGDKGVEIISEAIKAGYRHFDTASVYGNEVELGRAIKLSGLPREDFFICSKVWNDAQKQGPLAVRQSVESSLEKLGCEYLDVMYIHWPVPERFVESYKILQEFHTKGLVRNLGISNFGIAEYEELVKAEGFTTPPAVNQIEISPLMYRPESIKYFQARGVVMVASKGLHRGSGVDEGVIPNISAEHDATAAQILIRWGIQKGLVVVTKTANPSRMLENRAALSLTLTDDNVSQLDSLTSEADIRAREELEVQRKNGV